MRRFSPTAVALVALAVLVLLGGLYVVLGRESARSSAEAADASSDSDQAVQRRCASQRTYDRIKLELFRRAAETRGSDRALFDKLLAYSVVRMERPLLTNIDEELGTVRCSGRLSLDLPPGVAVVGGRRTLPADIDYVLQPAADGSGDVVMLEGADAIIVPLATIGRTGSRSEPASPSASPAEPVEEYEPARGAPLTDEAARPEPVASDVRPSFNCRRARTRGEIAICSDPGLAALDRQMAGQFYRSLSVASPGQRRRLTDTRDNFLRYRDRCPSRACIADSYRARMREISDIVPVR